MSHLDDADTHRTNNDSAPLVQELEHPSDSNPSGPTEGMQMEEDLRNFENQISDRNLPSHDQNNFTSEQRSETLTAKSLVKPIDQAGNTTEFLMLTLSKALKIDSKELQDLVSNKSEFLIDACAKGVDNDFQPVIEWLESVVDHMALLTKLFKIAYSKQQAVEVLLVLTSIRCGFFSENEQVCRLAIQALVMIADALFSISFSYGISVKKVKNVNKIVQVKVPIFRQFQDWFIQPKSFTSGSSQLTTRARKQAKQDEDLMNGLLRVVGETTLENHSVLAPEIAKLLLAVFRETTDPDLPPSADIVFLPEKLSEVFADDIFLSYSLLAQVLPEMRRIDRSAERNCVYNSKLVAMLMFRANEAEEDPSVRLQSLKLLLDLWSVESSSIINLPPQRGDQRSTKESFYAIVQAGLLHPDRVFKLAVYGLSFHVLDCLIEQRSAESPTLLKLMAQSMVTIMDQRKKDRIAEEFILRNFSILFEQNQDIPVSVIVDPLTKIFAERVKGYRKQGGTQHMPGNLSLEELHFLIKIAEHSRLTAQSAFAIFEIITTLYVSRPGIALMLIDSIIHIVEKFQNTPKILQFLDTILIAKALSMILTLKKDEQLKTSKSPYVQAAIMVNDVGGSTKASQSMSPKLKGQEHRLQSELNIKMQRYQMVHLIERLLDLKSDKIEPMVTEQIKPLADRYAAVFKQQSSAYEYLIDRHNLPVSKPLLALPFSRDDNQVALVESASQALILKETEPLSQFERRIRTIEKEKIRENQRRREKHLEEVTHPKDELALKAIEQVQQIRNRRIQVENQKRIEEVKRKERQERMQGEASQDVAMSRLIMERELQERKQRVREMLVERESPQKGRNMYQTPTKESPSLQMEDLNPFYQHLLNNPIAAGQVNKGLSGEELRLVMNYSKMGAIVNFEYDEEDRERDAMRVLVLKNKATLQYLFKKYSQFGNLNKRKGSIDNVAYERTISNGEIQKFLKDNQVDIAQKELFHLIKVINDAMFLRHGTLMLEFAGFVQLIIQMSIVLVKKGKMGSYYKSMLYAEMTYQFLIYLQEHARKKNEVPITVVKFDQTESDLDTSKGQKGQKPAGKDSTPLIWYEQKVFGPAKLPLGESKLIALELLNELFTENIGISLFEGVQKLGDKSQKSAKPKPTPFQQEALREFTCIVDPKQAKQKAQPIKAQEPPKPTGLDIYNVKNIIQIINLKPTPRQQKKDTDAERVLMGLNITPSLKLTCFELQQVNPQSLTSDLHEIALSLDEMVQSLHESRAYKSTIPAPKPARKFTLPHLQDLQPKREKYASVARELRHKEQSEKKKRDLDFHSRGQKLKEQVELNKRIKEQKELEQMQLQEALREQELKKQLAKQQAYLRQKQQMALQKERREQAEKEQEIRKVLREETEDMYRQSQAQLRKAANGAIDAFRKLFQNVKFNKEQAEFANDQETIKLVEQLYQKEELDVFEPFEDLLFDAFRKFLLFQNNVSRGQGMPGHKGINLDGVFSYAYYAQIVPQYLTLEDLAIIVRKHLEGRGTYPLQVGVSTEPFDSGENQAIQMVNFNRFGGTIGFEEFKILITRIVAHFEPDQTGGRHTATSGNDLDSLIQTKQHLGTPAIKEDQITRSSRESSRERVNTANVNDVLTRKVLQAQNLHIEDQVKPRAREIKQNFDAVKVFQQIVKDQHSERQRKGILIISPNMHKRQSALVENFLEISMAQLSQRSDMILPVMPLTNVVARVPQYSSHDLRQETNRSITHSRRNLSTVEQPQKARIRSQLKSMPTQMKIRAASQVQSTQRSSAIDQSSRPSQAHRLITKGAVYDHLY